MEAGVSPGISPDLHAPEIVAPGEEPEMNLHGDIEGSPFSREPGKISLAEAGEEDEKRRAKRKGADADASDEAATRERVIESRKTGISTETLAAQDEAGIKREGPTGEPPEAKSKASGSSKK